MRFLPGTGVRPCPLPVGGCCRTFPGAVALPDPRATMRLRAAGAVPPQNRLWDTGLERYLLRTRRILERQDREADRSARLDDEACSCPGGDPPLGWPGHVNPIFTRPFRTAKAESPSVAHYPSLWP